MDIELLFDRSSSPDQMTQEQRILVATLDCIAESGLHGSTVRAIAAKAGMNGASVNYYYRSKEKLVEAALRNAWVHVSQDIETIRSTTKDPAEALASSIRYLIEGAFRYPKIINAIIVEHPSLRMEAASYFKALFEGLGPPDSVSGLGTSLLLSFAVFMGIAPDAIAALTGLHLTDAAARDRLADFLASRVFAP
jgi:AcrR family transcriptional regulator